MNDAQTDTLAQLDRAIAANALPEMVQSTAIKLHARLDSPVRVTLLGLPGTGKSSVLGLLAGEELVPEGIRLPVLKLVWGDMSRTVVTKADGSSETLDGLDIEGAVAMEPAMVEVQTHLPALKRITLVEVGIGLARPEQARACAWAAKRTDLAIWCTRDFGAPEQAAWAKMPDPIKDQAILLRTRIDTAPNPKGALDRVDRLGRDEFDRVLAINTLAALAARDGDQVDRAAFKASGGQALIAAVLKVVDRTRQAFVDQADLLLARYGDLLGEAPTDATTGQDEIARAAAENSPELDLLMAVAAKVAAEAEDPVKTAAPVEPDDDQAVEPTQEDPTQTVADDTQDGTDETDTVPTPPEEAAATAGDDLVDPVCLPPVVAITPVTRKTFETAVAHLKTTGADLISGDAPPDGDAVLARSVKDLTWLDEHLELADGDDPALTSARDDVQEAVDMVQLMQIERNQEAAEDAIAIMLQLRRRFQQGLATP